MAIRTKDVEATLRLFRALGDETRLRLIEQLRGGEPEAFATLDQALTELKPDRQALRVTRSCK